MDRTLGAPEDIGSTGADSAPAVARDVPSQGGRKAQGGCRGAAWARGIRSGPRVGVRNFLAGFMLPGHNNGQRQ